MRNPNPAAPPQWPLAIELVDEVYRTHGRLVASRRSGFDDAGLQGTKSMVLNAVILAKEPPTVSRIARSLGYSRQSIQRTADILVGLGYLAFADNPHHLKSKVLVPTAAGRQLRARGEKNGEAWARALTRAVPAADLAKAVQVLRLVRRRLEEEARLEKYNK